MARPTKRNFIILLSREEKNPVLNVFSPVESSTRICKFVIAMLRAIFFFLVLILLVCAAAGYFAYSGWESLKTPVQHGYGDTIFTVARGEKTEHVLDRLEKAGIINNKLYLKAYIKLTGRKASIKAGDFKFVNPISPLAVLDTMDSGSMSHQKITVIEGSTIFDVAEELKAIPQFKLKSKAEAMALLNDTRLIRDLDPQAKNLEGYLFPDTYFYQQQTTASELVSSMVHRFKGVWKEELADHARVNKITAHHVVTIGSIIETEAKLKEERPIIASVIYNRLGKGINLSVDSTVVYASKLFGKWKGDGKIYKSDLRLNTPYNTRLYKGLPPGPVSNPGLSSMKAALNPQETNYIYYVRDPDFNNGKHNFYVTAAEFQKGVDKLRAWERKQKQDGKR